MINSVVLVGRLVRDCELRKVGKDMKSVCNFTLAIKRRGNEDVSDFIACVAWNSMADFIGTYGKKGDIYGIEGEVQSRSYDGKNGKVYVTEVKCNKVQALRYNKEAPTQEATKPIKEDEEDYDIQYEREDLPF